MPDLAHDTQAEKLARWRTMSAYRLAFFEALRALPTPTGTLYSDMQAAVPGSDQLAFMIQNVTIYERHRREVAMFATRFDLSDADVDLIFDLAMALERDAPEAEIKTLVAQWSALRSAGYGHKP